MPSRSSLFLLSLLTPDEVLWVPFRLVLRILPPDDSKAQCQLGMKYGAHPKDAPKLLKTAKDLGLNVIGVR